MEKINISISEFLERAISSSTVPQPPIDYAAMIVIAARAADARALHNEILEDWRSLDDLTGDAVIVAAPAPPDEASSVVREARKPFRGLAADGLAAQKSCPSRAWATRFWDAEPLPGPPPPISERAFEPATKLAASAGFTSSTSEVAAFFGLREQQLPCIVVLSFRGREAFFLRTTDDFKLYPFLRLCMAEYGPPPPYLDVKKQRDAAHLLERRTERELQQLERRLQHPRGTHLWGAQRDAVLTGLRALVGQDQQSADAQNLIEMLEHDAVPSADDDERAARLLANVGSSSVPSINRLAHKLPRALDRLRSGGLTGISDDDDDAALVARAESLRSELVHQRHETEALTEQTEDASRRFGFSPAVRAAATAANMAVRPCASWRSGWSSYLVEPVRQASQADILWQ